MDSRLHTLLTIFSLLVALLLAGCTSAPSHPVGSSGKYHGRSHVRIRENWYRVHKGDTLWSVAWRAGVDYHDLARWNHLRYPYTIYPGQKLRVRPPWGTTSRIYHSRHGNSGKKKKHGAKPPRRHRTKKGPSKHAMKWAWPMRGKLVSRFSRSNPEQEGIEISGKKGQKVRAAAGGTVVYSGSGLIGYGKLIIIKHNEEFLSAYGHNSRLLVKEGQKVKRGQHISDLGVNNTGKALLHFEIRRYGKPVDPLRYLPPW